MRSRRHAEEFGLANDNPQTILNELCASSARSSRSSRRPGTRSSRADLRGPHLDGPWYSFLRPALGDVPRERSPTATTGARPMCALFNFRSRSGEHQGHRRVPQRAGDVTLAASSSISVSTLPGLGGRASVSRGRFTRMPAWCSSTAPRLSSTCGPRSTRPRRPSHESSTLEPPFKRRRAKLAVEGSSDDGAVSLTSVRMSHFAVDLAPGTHNRIDGDTFAADVGQAATQPMHDQR